MSALSSGDLLASLPETMVEDITAFLQQAAPPYGAGAPATNGFPWPAVDQQEWILRRAKAAQVRSWSGLVHAAITSLPDKDDRDAKGGDPTNDSNDDGDGVPDRAVKEVADRMAVDFTQTPQQTTSDLRAAVALVDHLPRIFALFDRGRLDWTRARLIALRLLNPPSTLSEFTPGSPQWRLIEAALAAQAPSLARPRLERLITRLLLELTPDTAHEAAMTGRRVWADPLPDGMAFFGAIISADAAQYVMGVLEAMADACRDQANANGSPDPRTHQQRCADALTALFTVLGEGGDIPIVPTPTNPGTSADTDTDTGTSTGTDTGTSTGHASEPEPGSGSGSGATPSSSPGSADGSGPAPATDPSTAPFTNPGADPATYPGSGSAPGPVPTELLDELLNEQEAVRRGEQELFGIGPFPRPEDFTATPARSGALIPAWWRFHELPRRKGHGPHLTITSTDATWLGLSNTPALLHGYGAISAEQARKLGARPDQITILIFPTACSHSPDTSQSPMHPEQPNQPGGTVAGTPEGPENAPANEQECTYRQDHTTEQAGRYRPSRSLTDLITAVFSTCTFPQCNRPATRCDIDHLRPFSKGGPTRVCNLHPACRRHHQLKTAGQWLARPSRPDEPSPFGTIIWTTPDGHPHPSTPCLPGGLDWTPNQPIAPQALRQALAIRAFLSARQSQSDKPGSMPHDATREDTMPTAERNRLRQERWQKDVQRHPKTPLRKANRSQQEDRLQPEEPAHRRPTPPHSPSLSRPSTTGQHNHDGQHDQREEPPF